MPGPATPGEEILVASDHGGLELKEEIKRLLARDGFRPIDLGPESKTSVDYPEFAHALSRSIISGQYNRGILVCGTGIGMSMAANRTPGIRAALCHDTYTARMSREHNDANVLALGGRCLGMGVVEEMLKTWLETPFEGGRHERRVAKIEPDSETPAAGATAAGGNPT